MASIHDFNALFGGSKAVRTVPTVPLEGFSFTLLSIEPYHEWIETGEKRDDGTPKRVQSNALVTDETGERLRCVLGLALTDPSGLSTSASAPFIDRSHYFDYETVRSLTGRIGTRIGLENPRIELRESGKREDRWGHIDTRLVFAFDDVTL